MPTTQERIATYEAEKKVKDDRKAAKKLAERADAAAEAESKSKKAA